jgi:hypothetical protein
MSANVYGGFGKAAEHSSAQAAKAGIDYGPLVAEVRKSFNTGKVCAERLRLPIRGQIL